jgi:hypothetical protein
LKPRFPKPSDLFHGEDFNRGRLIRGNETTAVGRSCEGGIAIFADVSTWLPVGAIFRFAP